VRLEPGDGAKQIGTIAQDTRVTWTSTERGKGCNELWVAIEPRGWVCSDFLEAVARAPSGVELPRLARGELVPGTYGKITTQGVMTYVIAGTGKPPAPAPDEVDDAAAGAVMPDDGGVDLEPVVTADGKRVVPGKPLVGSVNVRKYGELSAGGRTYWKVTKSPVEYVLASVIHEHTPSAYRGVRLGDETGMTLPIGFVFPRGGGRTAWTYGTPNKTGARRQLVARDAVPILDTVVDPRTGKPTAYRVGVEEWMDVAALRVVTAAAPPKEMLDPTERWLDVDADLQVLVAYEGALPVYATLVSTGTKDTPTDPGVYRVWKKVMETDMRDLQSEDPYSVATVPWTQFFYPDDGLALHTAYWHDKFGTARSHGCVNLAPADARWLYFWSDPWVPPGWTMTAGVVEAPGSIVRIRTAAVPEPPLRGYAKRVWEAAQSQ
jgi:lipoprotein-anchoring transpeptidase ErfK/SrfK